MDWLGIGVLILAIGFAVLVVLLIPVLKKLTETLDNTAKTISQAEKSLDDITSETKLVLYNANETLMDVNHKVSKLDPLFDVVEDAGQATHHLTETLADYTGAKMDEVKTGAEVGRQKNLKGFVRGVALMYYLRKANKKRKGQAAEAKVKVTVKEDI
ncbi:DUF948 domain-containing protein [Alkalihalophilus marmarensis]|jgi:uncharacterized protein YoxC|uniref:General stress protein n=1 Tax=Alkalihalophilus marmarensis DSM 21297 TaxID=1188261 RepID=U6SP27_9BACI|nr:DUF948 domain-containing protein [Alkalihalophilus marmarensis]ERN53474.1 hypothetical protein A33I_11440 [Alkalihalophilus marmarensis DSM 21297]MCM3490889.1 DUF948 domain-containing protein [Alkalihalophilus marmarensis]